MTPTGQPSRFTRSRGPYLHLPSRQPRCLEVRPDLQHSQYIIKAMIYKSFISPYEENDPRRLTSLDPLLSFNLYGCVKTHMSVRVWMA
jgi:hypothetical protein